MTTPGIGGNINVHVIYTPTGGAPHIPGTGGGRPPAQPKTPPLTFLNPFQQAEMRLIREQQAAAREQQQYFKLTEQNQPQRANSIWKSMDANLRKVGLALTIGALIKHSQVASTTLGSIFKILGALVDLFLMPFIPLLVPVLKGLSSIVGWFAKFMTAENPLQFLTDSIRNINWSNIFSSAVDTFKAFFNADNLLKIILAGGAILGAQHAMNVLLKIFGSTPILAGLSGIEILKFIFKAGAVTFVASEVLDFIFGKAFTAITSGDILDKMFGTGLILGGAAGSALLLLRLFGPIGALGITAAMVLAHIFGTKERREMATSNIKVIGDFFTEPSDLGKLMREKRKHELEEARKTFPDIHPTQALKKYRGLSQTLREQNTQNNTVTININAPSVKDAAALADALSGVGIVIIPQTPEWP